MQSQAIESINYISRLQSLDASLSQCVLRGVAIEKTKCLRARLDYSTRFPLDSASFPCICPPYPYSSLLANSWGIYDTKRHPYESL